MHLLDAYVSQYQPFSAGKESLPAAGHAFLIAAALSQPGKKGIIIVAPDDGQARRLCDEVKSL
ncbi:MAG TPA: hypothetical protein PKC35_17495, partial [Leptospiraceae bacterium]|nr:hypothetical protein [Leptospiraceae bacterium]